MFSAAYAVTGGKPNSQVMPGASLGPAWLSVLQAKAEKADGGQVAAPTNNRHATDGGDAGSRIAAGLTIKYCCDPSSVKISSKAACSWPVTVDVVTTSDGAHSVDCDFVVSATGVEPVTDFLHADFCHRSADGGLLVDKCFRTSARDVYAAGDVCSVDWQGHSTQWQQMRLWSQARSMGIHAAVCMATPDGGDEDDLPFEFEVFAHSTHLFGKKVVLLGRHRDGAGLKALARADSSGTGGGGRRSTFIKMLLENGRLQGGALIGDTNLEDTFENLILSSIDLGQYGDNMLEDIAALDIDLEDYFD